MLKIYNTKHEFVTVLDDYKDLHETTLLDKGIKKIVFYLPITEKNINSIAEEYYIETSDYEYIIKEINTGESEYFTVYGSPNIEELQCNVIPVFDVIDLNLEQCFQKIIDSVHTKWTIEYHSELKTMVTYKEANSNALDLIKMVQQQFNLDIFYDTKNKIIKIYSKMGKDLGAVFTNELHLKKLKRQGQSYDFATVLYPIGKNGLTIGNINNNINYIENFEYCDKYLPKYWIQEDIEHAEDLKRLAEAHLRRISAPVVGYEVSLDTLPEGVAIGDNLLLIDKIKKIRTYQRIVKIVHYPQSPEKDRVELSNRIVNFADIFTKFRSNQDRQIQYIKNNISALK